MTAAKRTNFSLARSGPRVAAAVSPLRHPHLPPASAPPAGNGTTLAPPADYALESRSGGILNSTTVLPATTKPCQPPLTSEMDPDGLSATRLTDSETRHRLWSVSGGGRGRIRYLRPVSWTRSRRRRRRSEPPTTTGERPCWW